MLEIRKLNKAYITKGAQPVHALIDVSVKLENTGMVFVLGKSGSGKSTFLNVVGGLDKYDSGEIIIKGKSSAEFKGSDFDSYRNTYLGFIFQEYNLINEFTVGRNIALALDLQNRKSGPEEVDEILRLVDLGGLADRMPMQISGGQRQRVAIARALIKNPEIIMADEPTGALDSATGAAIFQTLQNLSKTRLVLIVSHDREFAEKYGDRIIEFSDGRIISDVIKKDEGFEETIEAGEIGKVEDIINVSKNAGLSAEHIQILTKLLEEKKAEEPKKRERRRGSFIPTKEEMLDMNKGNEQPFRLIKSKLPQRDALKMARSSMKHKKLRLVFSVLLSVIAITLFGFSSVVGGFSERNLAKSLIRDYGYQHMVLSKNICKPNSMFGGQCSISFSERDKERISEITGGVVANFYEIYLQLPINRLANIDNDVNQSYYGGGASRGLVATNDFKSLGLEVPEAYGRYPENENEILISNYLAESFLMFGMEYKDGDETKIFEPKKINDILSYNIKFDYTGIFKIVGIINFPIERYAPLKRYSTFPKDFKALEEELDARQTEDISFIYALPSIKFFEERQNLSSYMIRYGLPDIKQKDNVDNAYQVLPSAISYTSFGINSPVFTYLGKDGSSEMKPLEKGQMIVNISDYVKATDMVNGRFHYDDKYTFSKSQLQQYAESLGLFEKKLSVTSVNPYEFKNNTYYDYYSDSFEVVGVISVNNEGYIDTTTTIGIFEDDEFEEMIKEGRGESLFIYMENQRTANRLIDNFVGEFSTSKKVINKYFIFKMAFSEDVYGMAMTFKILSIVFFWMSIVLCVFAALLLLNFISASVTIKKKEIGILRAIGARKIDVVSIFLWEGILIGLMVLLISSVMVFGTVVLFNNIIGNLASIPFTMLVFGFLHFIYMALVCFITIAVASILPTRKVAAMKPMDAIRSI